MTLEVETDRQRARAARHLLSGWEAHVDGERRPILRANLLFRGVEMSAGRAPHRVPFRPLSLDNLSAAATDLMSKDEDDDQETVIR